MNKERTTEERQVNNKVRETVVVRGLCAAIQSMAMPTFQNLSEMLSKYGYTLTKNT